MHVAGVAKVKLGCSLGRVPNFVVQDELTSAQQSSTAEARTPCCHFTCRVFPPTGEVGVPARGER